ncbi:hypothetical protein BHE74_00051523 [Ensete ventricosum]|nr:hypothetical protein BHE74_00051523 [Ensete ventricosum]
MVPLLYLYVVDWSCLDLIILLAFSTSLFNVTGIAGGVLSVACCFYSVVMWFPQVLIRSDGDCTASGQMSSASSHSESSSIEMSTHRSRVLSRPSGDSRSSALISMFESMALAAPGTIDALVAMQSSFDVDSTVTTHRLVEVRKNYFIPPEYELHAPLLGERPYDAFSNGFSLSTDALEAEIFNLGKMKSSGGVGSRSAASPTTGMSASATTVESLVEKRPSVDEGLSLRKCS